MGAVYRIGVAGGELTISLQDDMVLPDRFEPFLSNEPCDKANWYAHVTFDKTLLPRGQIYYEDNKQIAHRDGDTLQLLIYPTYSTIEDVKICQVDRRWDAYRVNTLKGIGSGERADQKFFDNGMEYNAPFQMILSMQDGLQLHASAVVLCGKAYLFLAPSGTGKSTHARLWMKHFGANLLNDDQPVIRLRNDEIFVYGSPWSGGTPCYRNECAPIGGLCAIEQASINSIARMESMDALSFLYAQTSLKKFDEELYLRSLDTLSALVERVPMYKLRCKPDAEAAELAARTMM